MLRLCCWAVLVCAPVSGDVVIGVVVDDASGLPVEGAKLSLERADRALRTEAETVSDAGGRFRFEELEKGRYRVSCRKDGYLAWYGAHSPETFFEAQAEGAANPETIRLTRAGSIAGRLVTEEGEAIVGAEVRVVVVKTHARGRSDAEGRFRIEGLAESWWQLEATIPFEERRRSVRVEPSTGRRMALPDTVERESIAVGTGEHVEGVVFRVQRVPVMRLRGEVTLKEGALPEEAEVEVRRPGVDMTRSWIRPEPYSGEKYRLQSGRFEADLLTGGAYEAVVSYPWSGGKVGFPQAVEVGTTDAEMRIVVPNRGRIAGVVREPAGGGLEAVAVSCTSGSVHTARSLYLRAKVGAGGKFEFRGLMAGECRLSAFMSRLGSARTQVAAIRQGGARVKVLEIPDGESIPVEMELALSFEVKGVVVDQAGRTVAGAMMDFSGQRMSSGAEGEFEIRLPEGTHRVKAWAKDRKEPEACETGSTWEIHGDVTDARVMLCP